MNQETDITLNQFFARIFELDCQENLPHFLKCIVAEPLATIGISKHDLS